MKYTKYFDTESNYISYRDDKNKYLKPNVSLCKENKTVYYNYPPPPKTNGHDYVDLGLPSGTLWATMNVGASKASDAGLYFQWGDTQGYTASQVGTGSGQKAFSWSDYKWNPSGDGKTFTKYNTGSATLELEDDAAHVHMGGDWHMPTYEQIQELINAISTTTAWTTSDGVSGMTFTSKKDKSKSIFIPAAGYVYEGSLLNSGRYGNVWISKLDNRSIVYGNSFLFDLGSPGQQNNFRFEGCSVRGVIG